jgi:hypothetical protein
MTMARLTYTRRIQQEFTRNGKPMQLEEMLKQFENFLKRTGPLRLLKLKMELQN